MISADTNKIVISKDTVELWKREAEEHIRFIEGFEIPQRDFYEFVSKNTETQRKVIALIGEVKRLRNGLDVIDDYAELGTVQIKGEDVNLRDVVEYALGYESGREDQ